MIVVNSNKIINSNEQYISESKITNRNNKIYSKIAPPNTFKKKNPNQILRGSKILQRNEKSPKSNKIINPYINNSNIIKNNSISKSHIILNDFKINSSFRDKTKFIKSNNIFINNNINNSHNLIVTPKKLLFAKMNIKGNKINFNKNKTEIQNITNRITKEEVDSKRIYVNNIKNNKRIKDNDIKEKYDLLLKRTKELLNNYQNIIDYYQEREKNFKIE